MGKKSFLKGAAILGIAGLLVQVMGAIFRIPLGNIIGDEGMGYYQTAYPIYVFLLVFSTNGAPAAISKMTSERIAVGRADEAHRVFKLSFILMAAFGIAASSLIYFGANKIISIMSGHPDAYYAMAAIAPALLFVPIMSVFRGYFQGMQDMGPTAASQLVEQAVRVAAGLTLAFVLLSKGVKYAAAGGTSGASIGPVAGVLVLIIIYMRRRKKIFAEIEESGRGGTVGSVAADSSIGSAKFGGVSEGEKESAASILKTLFLISIPITIGVSILPIMNMADVALVMGRLQSAGFSVEEANALYGQLTGLAGPIINIPMALALSMALSMVPAIAAAHGAGDDAFLAENVRLGLRTSIIIGCPCSFGLMALSEPIMRLLYPMQTESAVSSASCLFILAIGVVFLCAAQTMAGALQGLGKPGIAVWSLLGGLVAKCAVTYILTSIPSLNVDGAAIGSTVGYIVIGLANFIAVRKMTGITFDMKLSVVKPLFSSIVMYVVVVLIYKVCSGFIGNSIATLLSIAVGAAAYGILLLKSKAITGEEIETLPKGKKLAGLCRKLRLI